MTSKYIRLNYQCYNDKITEYLSYLSENFQKCQMDEAMFKNVIDKKVRTQKNALKGEPYSKIMMYFIRAVLADHTPEQYIEAYSSITYNQFLEFKDKFMKSLWLEWLICGHLQEKDAINMCETFRKGFEHEIMPKEQKPERKKMF